MARPGAPCEGGTAARYRGFTSAVRICAVFFFLGMVERCGAFFSTPASAPIAPGSMRMGRGPMKASALCLRAAGQGADVEGVGIREALALALGIAQTLAAPGQALAADANAKDEAAARVAKQMAIVKFTRTIDDATNQALKLV